MRKLFGQALAAALAAIAIALLATGCGDKVVGPEPGVLVHIPLGEKAGAAELFRVTVTGADMDTVVAQMQPRNDAVEIVLNVPVGSSRRFVVEALDALREVMFRGETVVDVLPFAEMQLAIDLRPMVPMLYFSPHFPTVPMGNEFTLALRAAKLPGLRGLSFELAWQDLAPVLLDTAFASPRVLEAGADMWEEGRYFGIYSEVDPFVDAEGDGVLAYFRFSTYEAFAAGAHAVPLEIELNDLDGVEIDLAGVYLDRALLRLENPNAVETLLGGAGSDEGRAVVALPGGDFMVAGVMGGGGQDNYQAPFLARIAPNGTARWQRVYPSDAAGQVANGLARGRDGSLYLVGEELGYHKEVGGSFVYRTDSEGRLLFEAALDTVLNNPIPTCVAGLPRGGAVVAGYYWAEWWDQCFVATFDASGLRDVLLIPDVGAIHDIVAVSDTAFVAVGTQDALKAGDIALWRVVDGDGLHLSWTRIFSGQWDEGFALALAPDGDFFIAGTTTIEDSAMRIIRTDPDGFERWERTVSWGWNTAARAIVATPDGGCVVAGDSFASEPTGIDVIVVRLDAAGNTVWERTYGGAGTDRAYGIARGTSGGYLLVGTTDSARLYDNDVLLLRLNEEGLKFAAD
ncbi:MAG: hypothetical protein RBT60_09240 [Candidatus Krumholzibacteria bacterium]|jgi:hypothetical protein|nr:hypothetical protein [Candidatus Krumholzibacteria bacterium]